MRRVLTTCLIFTALLAGVSALVLRYSGERRFREHAPLTGMDTGARAQVMIKWDLTLLEEWGRTKPWIRLRGHPIPVDQSELIALEVDAQHRLTELGFKPIILLRWGEKTWQNGIRPGGGQRLPHDLREAYQRAFDYGRIYGATGAAFEFENEPDISFVQENPETYLAFLKACYLGVKQGAAAGKLEAEQWKPETGNLKPEYFGSQTSGLRSQVSGLVFPVLSSPRVVMAPLALPPGPYFEQMVANGLFSYTDAFNYHYYGYAEDFEGVYGQFAQAVSESTTRTVNGGRDATQSDGGSVNEGPMAGTVSTVRPGAVTHNRPPKLLNKQLPVLLSEYGYGGLGKEARDTVEGRVRQWQWFKSVGEDIARLRIAGPMAFYLPPYLERDQLEFGLTMGAAPGKPETGNLKPELSGNPSSGFRSQVSGLTSGPSGLRFQVSGLTFSPSDFGQPHPESWMNRIGQRFGENETTPALAWLMGEGANRPYVPNDWAVAASLPSPVVIDFIAGDGLAQAKRYGGYVAQRFNPKPAPPPIAKPARPPETPKPPKGPQGPSPPPVPGLPKGFIPPPAWFGTGAIVLYNFSDQTVSGRLWIERGGELLFEASTVAREWTLDPMSRTVVEINLRIPALSFTRNEFTLRFTHEKSGTEEQKPETGDLKPELSGSQTSGLKSHVSGLESPSSSLRSQVSGLVSIFSTAFFPNYPLMRETMVHDFTARDVGLHLGARLAGDAEGADQGPALQGNSAAPPPMEKAGFGPVLHRPCEGGDPALQLASEEPRLTPAGRWRVTPAVSVEEAADRTWRFRIEGFPSKLEKSAIAELPLSDDFEFPAGAMLRFSYRLAQPAGATLANGKYMEAYFRTANGNLYQVWPRQYAMAAWSDYTEVKENYTMAFYGRANLPWRFKDNRPVALVFFFRPGRESLPAVYEVRDPRIVRLGERSR